MQHHYGVNKADAHAGLLDVLRSGLVARLDGRLVLAALEASDGPALFDRLIANGYNSSGLVALTLDQEMAGLPGVRRLWN